MTVTVLMLVLTETLVVVVVVVVVVDSVVVLVVGDVVVVVVVVVGEVVVVSVVSVVDDGELAVVVVVTAVLGELGIGLSGLVFEFEPPKIRKMIPTSRIAARAPNPTSAHGLRYHGAGGSCGGPGGCWPYPMYSVGCSE